MNVAKGIQFIVKMIEGNLKNLKETKSPLKAERQKENLGKQDLQYDLEEVFDPLAENQKLNQIKEQSLSE